MPKKKTLEEFITDARKIHGSKYDYSKLNYQGNSTKVAIICSLHGEFLKSPAKHLAGQGCRICNGYVELNQVSFIDRAIKTHGNKYDYSKTEIKNKNVKVIIICSVHGEFKQLPLNHIKGAGCPECAKILRATSQRYSTQDFIDSIRKVHGEKYDYSEVSYINSQSKIKIICPKHGPFLMKPNSHFNGQGCPNCGRISARENITLEYKEFLKRVEKIHGNQYVYVESTYKNYTSKMRMHCSEHGFFEQTPHSHISMKTGCPLCGNLSAGLSNQKGWEVVQDMFISVHATRYKYDSSSYRDVSHKMRIECSKHGWFEQKPYQHYMGHGCKKCGAEENAEKKKITFSDFIEKSMEIHGKKYSYDQSEYIDIFTPIYIICSKHGEFLQAPRNHYRGSGCPKCNSSKGEEKIRYILNELSVEFIEQKTFDDLIHKKYLRCDFYLPNYNTVIEFNGIQHYEPILVFGGIKGLIENQTRDMIKYNFLNENKIDLIIVRYDNEDLKNYLINKLNISNNT
jgi:predicted nucleic-acid-binding Zn-ribbon protein